MTHLDDKRKPYDFLSELDAVFAGAEGVALGFVESDLSAGADAVVSAFVSLLSADFSVALSPEDSPAAVFGFEADFALSFSARKSVT